MSTTSPLKPWFEWAADDVLVLYPWWAGGPAYRVPTATRHATVETLDPRGLIWELPLFAASAALPVGGSAVALMVLLAFVVWRFRTWPAILSDLTRYTIPYPRPPRYARLWHLLREVAADGTNAITLGLMLGSLALNATLGWAAFGPALVVLLMAFLRQVLGGHERAVLAVLPGLACSLLWANTAVNPARTNLLLVCILMFISAWLESQFRRPEEKPVFRTPRATPLNPFVTRNHLQITFTTDEYTAIIAHLNERNRFQASWNDPVFREYWTRLPRYVVARCPYCNTSYTEPLDTHSLSRWGFDPNRTDGVFTKWFYQQWLDGAPGLDNGPCPHFLAVSTTFNLNGTVPVECDTILNRLGELPYVLAAYMPDDTPAVAVLHSLPICRVEGAAFVPRYLLFTVTYYAGDGDIVRNRIREARQKLLERYADDPMHAPQWWGAEGPHAYDLAYWVRWGKLQWLDPSTPDLALQAGSLAAFPYPALRGLRQTYRFWNKHREPQPPRYLKHPLWQGPEGWME